MLQAILPKSSDWSDFTARGEWSGSRLTQVRGKSLGLDTEQLGKVFPMLEGMAHRASV